MKWVVAFFAFAGSCGAFAQGAFQNLDFEQADPAGGNTTAALFPEWSVYFGSTLQSVVGYDPVTRDSIPTIWIDDRGQPFQGNYSAFLQSAGGGGLNVDVSLVQTGLVPSGTESIEFDAFEENNSSFVLTFDGKDVNMEPLQTFQNYTVYGGDVSEWSGQNATLNITQLSPPSGGVSLLELDDISFSPNGVTVTPEPDPVLLMGIGGALFAAYRRFAPKRK